MPYPKLCEMMAFHPHKEVEGGARNLEGVANEFCCKGAAKGGAESHSVEEQSTEVY